MSEQKKSLKGSWLWGALLFVLLLLIDMVTKIVADAYFDLGDPYVKIIPGYLEWGLTYNRGVAFSMLTNATPTVKMALVCSTGLLFVVFAIVYLKMDARRTWVRMALIFIIAGGVGNFIDRVYYKMWIPGNPAELGGVRDMVALKIWIFDFGMCNFADFFIVGGAIALMAGILFFDAEALYPLTKKYKALSKEYAEKAEQKESKKQEKAKACAVETATEAKQEKKEE